eukprot:403364603
MRNSSDSLNNCQSSIIFKDTTEDKAQKVPKFYARKLSQHAGGQRTNHKNSMDQSQGISLLHQDQENFGQSEYSQGSNVLNHVNQSQHQSVRGFKDYKNVNFKEILIKSFKIFGQGLIVKLLFTLVSSRLNIRAILNKPQPILRFGVMCFSLTFVYKLLRFLMQRLKLNLSRDSQVFLAAALSSLSLLIAHPNDLNLLKILIFPRAIEALYYLLVERGILRPIPNGEYLMISICCIIVTYFYMHEVHILEPSLKKSIDKYMNLTKTEKMCVNAFQQIMRNMVSDRYPNNKLVDFMSTASVAQQGLIRI